MLENKQDNSDNKGQQELSSAQRAFPAMKALDIQAVHEQ